MSACFLRSELSTTSSISGVLGNIKEELDRLEANEELDSDEYDHSEEEEEDDIIMISGCKENKKKPTHVDATAAIDVLREYISSLNLSSECTMSLARLQRQIISELSKTVNQQPSINSIFPSKSKK